MAHTDSHDRLPLPSRAHAALLARRHVNQVGCGWPGDVLDDTLLATSELVSNAVQYTAGDITLVIQAAPETVRVEVHDQGDPLEQTRPPAAAPDRVDDDDDDEHGRGLFIVAAIADRWGITDQEPPPGKAVWFELDLTRPAAT